MLLDQWSLDLVRERYALVVSSFPLPILLMGVLDAQALVNIKKKVGLVALIALESLYNLSGTHGHLRPYP